MKNSDQSKIVVLGGPYIDIVAQVPEIPSVDRVAFAQNMQTVLGGKATHTSVGMARLGLHPLLLGICGADDFGDIAVTALTTENIVSGHLKRTEQYATGAAMVIVNAKGKNVTVVHNAATHSLTKADLTTQWNEVDAENARLAYVTLEFPENLVQAFVELCHSSDIEIVCGAGGYADVYKLLNIGLDRVMIITANQEEATALTGHAVETVDDAYAAARDLRGKGARSVIITLASLGSVVLPEESNDPVRVKATPVDAVIDETGAGDAYQAGLIYALLEGKSLLDAAHIASRVAAFTVTSLGAYQSMPTLEQLQTFVTS